MGGRVLWVEGPCVRVGGAGWVRGVLVGGCGLGARGVGGGGVEVGPVGDEGVVAPVGPEFALGLVGEAAAPHDQAQFALVAATRGDDGGLGDCRLAADGVGNGRPVVLADGGFDVGIQGHRDRPVNRPAIQAPQEVVAEEPRIGAHGQCARGARPDAPTRPPPRPPKRHINAPAANKPASATNDPSSKTTSNRSIPCDTPLTGSAS